MRVAGELKEIRAADLAFTLGEARELLTASGVDAAPEVVEQLWERTEGWAAGLRLAALALRGHADPARFVAEFAGDDSTVADYLLGEVLAQQPEDLRQFLLHISVVDLVDGELADALSERTDSERVLAQLERDHALLSSTGGARAWHRLHPLFAELLRSELRYRDPDAVAPLHSRAAKWFHEHDRPIDALRHAAAAEDWEFVGTLAGAHWVRLLLEGELDPLRKVLDQLPEDLVRSDPEIAIALAGAHVDAGDDAKATRWFRVAREGRDAVAADRRPAFDVGMATVGLLRGRLRGDYDEALGYARAMLEPADADGLVDDSLRALARLQLGIAEVWIGNNDRARDELETARAAATAAGRDWLLVQAVAHLALQAMVDGRYERASMLAADAAKLAERRGWCQTWPVGLCELTLSGIAFHQEHLEDAGRHCARASERLRHSGDRPLRGLVAMQRGRIDAAHGRHEAALEAIREAREWLHDWPIVPVIPALIAAIEATVTAALGEREEAIALLEREPASLEAAVARANLALHDGEPALARTVVEPLLASDERMVRHTVAEGWAIVALADDALADHPAASAALERALDYAEPAGLRRPFLMHGASIGPLLRRQQRAGTGHRALLDNLIEAIEQPNGTLPQMLAEPLSQRESAVLRFLPTMMSNQEIAGELFVSVNTVKTHLKAIYRKLGVDDRRGAVRRARELSLLGPH